MKSRTSLFNAGIARNLLRRFWPLWVCYFAGMLFLLPMRTYSAYGARRVFNIVNFVYSDCIGLVYISVVVGLVAAMAMFGYMYSTRSCGMMNALPIKREAMFMTAYLTGLMPLIAADIIVEMATAGVLLSVGIKDLSCVFAQLAVAVTTNIAFYGFAVFCAMLTGSILILPLAYAALGLSAWICEGCVRHILSEFVYGMSVQTHFFDWLSPAVTLVSELGLREVEDGKYVLSGLGWAFGYCAAGIAASVLALLLYRRRHMETATDTVAIPVLKPIFKYCMSFGAALIAACVLYRQIFYNSRGYTAAAGELLLLLLGAFVGYFAAKMIINKTMDVFRRGWKGFIIAACVLTALTACFELDAFGYERRVPDIESIASARLCGMELKEPENIRAIAELQKKIIEDKKLNEQTENRNIVRIEYTLKNGRVMKRAYLLDFTAAAQNDPDSDIYNAQVILNCREALIKRTELSIPVNTDTIEFCTLECSHNTAETGYVNESLSLTREQAVELYEQCILPDIEDGTLGKDWLTWEDVYKDTVTNVTVNLSLYESAPGTINGRNWDYLYLDVTVDAERTIAWIAENMGIACEPLRIACPDDKGKSLYD